MLVEARFHPEAAGELLGNFYRGMQEEEKEQCLKIGSSTVWEVTSTFCLCRKLADVSIIEGFSKILTITPM